MFRVGITLGRPTQTYIVRHGSIFKIRLATPIPYSLVSAYNIKNEILLYGCI